MIHAIDRSDAAELAACYVSGAMPADELGMFEAHLESGCEDCWREVSALAPVADALVDGMTPLKPDASVWAALESRIERHASEAHTGTQVWRQWGGQPAATGLFTLPSDATPWEKTDIAGVEVRRLFADRAANRATMLVRMAAGAGYPKHLHNGPEECLVLEGDLHVGEIVMRAGDYQRADVGSVHGVQHTEGGCVLLILSAFDDELV